MALISVLWGIALLSVIAASFLSAGNTSYHLARNALEVARTDATVEAAVNRGILTLLDSRPEKRWRVDGIAQLVSLDGVQTKLAIQDELGRIDINVADGTLLVALLQSVGLDAKAAASLTDKILDWRDATPSKRLNGAKAEDYRMAGRAYRPRNGPFQSIDELRLVMDMTPELFKRLTPAVTVYSGSPYVDARVAPAQVLLALPGMDQGKVASLIAARTGSEPTYGPAPLAAGRAFSIRAEVQSTTTVSTREVVVRLTDRADRPYWVLSWRSR